MATQAELLDGYRDPSEFTGSCQWVGCSRKLHARGLCDTHYSDASRRGVLETVALPIAVLQGADVLEYIAQHPKCTVTQIADRFGRPISTINYHIRVLEARNRIRRKRHSMRAKPDLWSAL